MVGEIKAGTPTPFRYDLRYEPIAIIKPFTSRIVRRAMQAHRLRQKTPQAKWLLQHRPFLAGQTTSHMPLPEISTQECYSDVGISDLEWLHGVLKQTEAGEELPRDSFHRLYQILKDLTSTGDLEWLRLSILKTIVHRHKQTVDSRSTVTLKPRREPMSPKHLKVIPPIKGKEESS